MSQLEKLNLIKKIQKMERSNPRNKEILISIDDYFNGNDERSCIILANTSANISSEEFEKFLRGLKNTHQVSDIFIRFYDFEDALDFDDAWINSDTVYVITSAAIEEVGSWFHEFEPSSINKIIDLNTFANLPCIPDNYRVISIWWD